MYPEPIENFYAPTALSEALDLLAKHSNEARLIAGGQSLVPQMRAREVKPRTLIDLNRITDFTAIEINGDRLRIGALVRHRAVASDASLHANCAAFAEAARAIGDRQVRNRGTLLGNIVNADHTADMLGPAIAFDARLGIAGAAGGMRSEPVESFVTGPRECGLAADEIVSFIDIPLSRHRTGSCYLKHGRVAQDRATLGVAARILIGAKGGCIDARVVVTGVLPKPVRLSELEAALLGKTADRIDVTSLSDLAAGCVATQSDELASSAYRTQLLRVMTPDAVAYAFQRAR
ncbi:MAG: FAD binding domain-containing protein [Gammaproteobacteria bacterium]|nr:FAD binding domain-containing protein [Gammaproteobacteria bacterium]